MKYIQKTNWKTIRTYNNGNTLETPNAKKLALDIGLKITGGLICYGLGQIIGEITDNIPYINQILWQTTEYISGLNTYENLNGLTGLIGGIYGFMNSGTKTFKDNPNKLEKITISNVYFKFKK